MNCSAHGDRPAAFVAEVWDVYTSPPRAHATPFCEECGPCVLKVMERGKGTRVTGAPAAAGEWALRELSAKPA